MNKTRWIIFIVIIFGILAMLVAASSVSKLDVSQIDTNKIQLANEQNGQIAEHTYGKVGSKVVLIEYGDYQCVACGRVYPIVKSIKDQYKDQVLFVFRNFPLTAIHPNGKAAAAVVEAAGLQGKFWEMFDKIYSNQSDWSELTGESRTNFFTSYASELGLDTTKFNSDIAKPAISKKISYDAALGKKASVDATPTFFLNGKKLDISMSSDEAKMRDVINTELKKAGIELPK